jgi:subtilisin family serine protease
LSAITKSVPNIIKTNINKNFNPKFFILLTFLIQKYFLYYINKTFTVMKKIILFLVFLFAVSNMTYSQFQKRKVTLQLEDILNFYPDNEKIRVIIHLSDYVDINKFNVETEHMIKSQADKTELLINTLRNKAKSTQSNLLSFLQYNKYKNKIYDIKDFWIINAVAVYADVDIVKQVTFRNDVGFIEVDNPIFFDDEEESYSFKSDEVNTVETGLKVIKADKLWKLGITGVGTIVMNIDSGVDGNHPAFNSRWRGLIVPWYHAWFDANGASFPTWCTDHGTHTMGIMCGLGQTTGDTVGVAFGAHWISARRLCSGNYTNFGIAAFQWGLDPDSNASTRDEASVISCSWNSSDSTGNECNGSFKATLITLEAGGVPVVWSSGNNGPNSSSISSPKNINTNEVNAFTVGAVDGNTTGYPIASFSSRGPSICGGTGSLLIKPEVSAPGVDVRSCVLNSAYGLKSGTSMAAPHGAGAVALLRSFAPNITGKMSLLALYYSATDLGTTGEDNNYGMGLINVFEAMKILGMSIAHTPLNDTLNVNGPFKIRVTLNKSTVVNAKLDTAKIKVFWSRNSVNLSDSISMSRDTGNVWFANIPGNGSPAVYRYFIRLYDTLGVRAQSPADAPFANYSFNAGATIIEDPVSNIPVEYFLAQNYPNPFNPSTTIKFGIKKTGFVKLSVFDISGRLVSELINNEFQPGIYEVNFDAGRHSSGIYFYKLETEFFTDVKRMTLLK